MRLPVEYPTPPITLFCFHHLFQEANSIASFITAMPSAATELVIGNGWGLQAKLRFLIPRN